MKSPVSFRRTTRARSGPPCAPPSASRIARHAWSRDCAVADSAARGRPASLIDFARRFQWNDPSRGRWRMAPATDEGAMDMVFLRGTQDAFRVRFEARDGDWVIAGFEPTERSLE